MPKNSSDSNKSVYKKAKEFVLKNYFIVFIISALILWPLVPHPFLALVGGFFIFLVTGQIIFNGKRERRDEAGFVNTSHVFDEHLAVFGAWIIKADGDINEKQINYFETRVRKEYFRRDGDRIIARMKFELHNPHMRARHFYEGINDTYTVHDKLVLLQILVSLSVVDGYLAIAEQNILQEICANIEIPQRTLDSILNMYRFRSEYHEQRRQQQKSDSVSAVDKLKQALKILELEAGATVEEIKKAYKRLAKIHHPDKVSHLGENAQKIAAEKFKTIVVAYDFICEKKGIV
ncbi:MAG: DnaJ domain-containing protein [Crocinitomicaceae bacterium]|nr:DnaJ domain-containing protein [Crocinitomicaceae bacterium]MBK8927243.1 DnaJ domain-containing protein [Crocinitomicaceae bacterium]